jgi:anti-sigma-K factor RskA
MTIDPQDKQTLADEYVLGLMSQAESAEFEKRLAQDSALARLVGQAQDRFLPLDSAAPPADLPADFTARVMAQIAKPDQSQISNLPNAPLRRWWPAVAAACVGLIVGIGIGVKVSERDPLVIAVLLSADGTPQAVIEDFGNRQTQVRFVADVKIPEGRTLQVWTLPSQETGPVSLGLIDAAAAAQLRGPDLPLPKGAQLYEITIEPEGGSPTGRPTGPILGKGLAALQAL